MVKHLILEQTCLVACMHVGIVGRIERTPSGAYVKLTSVLTSILKLQGHLPGHYPATLRCERSATTHWPEN